MYILHLLFSHDSTREDDNTRNGKTITHRNDIHAETQFLKKELDLFSNESTAMSNEIVVVATSH